MTDLQLESVMVVLVVCPGIIVIPHGLIDSFIYFILDFLNVPAKFK